MDFGKIIERSGIGLTAAAVVWMFSTFASAADIKRIETRSLRAELRNVCYRYRTAETAEVREWLSGEVLEVLDELCAVMPDDRRCSEKTADSVCR